MFSNQQQCGKNDKTHKLKSIKQAKDEIKQ